MRLFIRNVNDRVVWPNVNITSRDTRIHRSRQVTREVGMASQSTGIQQLLAAEKRAAEKVGEARKRT